MLIVSCRLCTVEFSGSNKPGTMKIGSSQRQFKPARVSFYIYKLNSRDCSPIYGASIFMLLFSFSIFSDT